MNSQIARVAKVAGVIALGLGVCLAGWGLDDAPGFFAHPARAGLLLAAVLFVAASLFLRVEPQPFRRGRRPVGGQRWALAGLMVFSLFLFGFLPYGDRRGVLTFAGADWARYVGLGLYLAGNAVGLVALRTLGKQYSGYVTLQDDHALVQTGIYGIIRHPIYLRALLALLGVPLVFRSWMVLPLWALGLVFVSFRIRQEEKLLRERFGAAFDDYSCRTWRLIPYVY